MLPVLEIVLFISSTEDSSVISTEVLTVLKIVLLPAMSHTEAFLSVMSSTEDSSVTSTRNSTDQLCHIS